MIVPLRAICAAIVITCCCGAPAAAGQDSGALYEAIKSRLSLMKPVAAWKLASGVAVEDLAREKVVLEKTSSAATALGISAQTATAFFQAQIDAAKEIQHCWIGRWEKGTSPRMTSYPDLKTQIRPDLIRLGNRILTVLKANLAQDGSARGTGPSGFTSTVRIDCLSEAGSLKIYQALLQVRLAE